MTSESLPAAAMVLAQGLWLELVSRRREPAGDESADDDHAQTDAVRDEHGDGVVGDEVQEPGDRRKRHDQRDERSDDGRAPATYVALRCWPAIAFAQISRSIQANRL